MSRWEMAGYGGLMVLQAMVNQLSIEIGAGRVPIPPAWQWVMPVVSAGLVTLSILLPSVRRR